MQFVDADGMGPYSMRITPWLALETDASAGQGGSLGYWNQWNCGVSLQVANRGSGGGTQSFPQIKFCT